MRIHLSSTRRSKSQASYRAAVSIHEIHCATRGFYFSIASRGKSHNALLTNDGLRRRLVLPRVSRSIDERGARAAWNALREIARGDCEWVRTNELRVPGRMLGNKEACAILGYSEGCCTRRPIWKQTDGPIFRLGGEWRLLSAARAATISVVRIFLDYVAITNEWYIDYLYAHFSINNLDWLFYKYNVLKVIKTLLYV